MLLLLKLEFDDRVELLNISDELFYVQDQTQEIGFYLRFGLVLAQNIIYQVLSVYHNL